MFRRVAKGEKATATVLIEEIRKSDVLDAEGQIEETLEYKIEKPYKLFHVSQTKPIRKTALNIAQHEFYEYFVRHADRNKLIRWTKGEWTVDEQGEKWWDESVDVWGWRIYQEHFSLDQAIAHLNGTDIYGVFGAKSSAYLLIDLDLHNQPLDLLRESGSGCCWTHFTARTVAIFKFRTQILAVSTSLCFSVGRARPENQKALASE